MYMKTFLFAAALLQAVKVSAAYDEHDENNFDETEEINELGLTAEELIQSSISQDIHDNGYFRSEPYHAKTAIQKLDELWELLVPSDAVHPVPIKSHMWKEFDNFFVQKANGPFCDSSDELRRNRKKTTHTQGLVAKIEWKPLNDPTTGAPRFTGIYAEGTETSIIRFSETKNLTQDSEGLLPSFAIKFLIDKHKSENLFAMPNMTGKYKRTNENGEEEQYSSWDFFHGTFKSRVAPFDESDTCNVRALEAKFLESNNRPYATSVSRPAFWKTKKIVNGEEVTVEHYKPEKGGDLNPKDRSLYQFPFQLEYEGVHNFDNNRNEEWYDRLRYHFNTQCQEDSQKEGHCTNDVPILNVYAWSAPAEDMHDLNGVLRGSERHHIATINLKTKLYSSEAGDTRLFFQHIRVNKDYRMFPREWKRGSKAPSDFPDFTRERETPEYEMLQGLTKKDHKEGTIWPWPSEDGEAEAKYLRLSAAGCPFSWLWENEDEAVMVGNNY